MIRQFILKRKNHMAGAVIIEFAFTFPILIFLIFALVEIGWLLHVKLILDNATMLGARVLATNETNTIEAEKIVKKHLNDFNLLAPDVYVRGSDADPNCISASPVVSMAISLPLSSVSLLGDPFKLFTQTKSLNVKMTLHKECLKLK